jgi:hypothetical protein
VILKIFLTSSLVLNSFLLIYLFGLIPFLLFLSVIISMSMVAYTRFLLNERQKLQNDFNILMTKVNDFLVHLSGIYELEMFYGDETLKDLIIHSRELINDFYDYEDEYYQEQGQEQFKGDDDLDDTSEEKES